MPQILSATNGSSTARVRYHSSLRFQANSKVYPDHVPYTADNVLYTASVAQLVPRMPMKHSGYNSGESKSLCFDCRAQARQATQLSRPSAKSRSHREISIASPLPIPPKAVHDAMGGSYYVDLELARMYDNATWNMYARIVNARRQRLKALNSQQPQNQPSSVEGDTVNTNHISPDPKPVRHDISVSRGSVTEDESDKSTTVSSSIMSSSSLRRTDGSLGLLFAGTPTRSQLRHFVEADNEENFIFQLDM